jgi:signal transduction histidine kinase
MFISIIGPEFFIRAVIRNPQKAIFKEMLIILLMSVLLVALTVFCFWYIFKTIIQQKKLSELKDDFINNMTHELKTPIATMTVAIEGLQKYNALNDPDKTQRYLQTSRNELTRLNDIVSRVLNVAAFGSDEVKLVKESINVDELINDVIEVEKLKANKPVTIYYENKSDIKTINADKLHFRNVMVNLIDNAIKYSNEQVLIIITCYKVGSNALFSVKDNGIGIPASHISQVFNKFHRVPTGNVHDVKGTGLGLSYVKYVIEAHSGSVIAESEPNTGSEFIISIPYNQ